MSDKPSESDDTLPLEAYDRIDRICLEFEAAWKADQPPSIEVMLSDSPEPERSALFRELLLLELDYCLKNGAEPRREEYEQRFPDHSDVIARAFEHAAANSEIAPMSRTRLRYFGDYELLEEIARGGMGVVYRARQISLNRTVAVKMILKGHLARDADVTRFHTEAAAAANLQHPHIVAIHEVGMHEGQHYFSMDYVDGPSLAELLRESPNPPIKAAAYVAKIAEAVHYAHEQGILHRDLKPSNVLIDASDQPRITDFGLAKRLEEDSDVTATGEILGTASYMSPEQASGNTKELDRATDVYSIGAILYELLTGRPPFRGPTILDTLVMVRTIEPIPPRMTAPQVQRDLETICLKCLDKCSGQRYTSAKALTDDLERFLRGEPILARPTSRAEKLWRWCRRKPALSSALGAMAVAVVVTLLTLVVSVVLVGRSRNIALDLADANARLADEKTELADRERDLRVEAEVNLYCERIALADRQWQANNVAEADEILDACPERLRKWEWYYLKRLCHAEQLSISIKPSKPHWTPRVTYSPDGERLACGGSYHATTIWDAHTGSQILALDGSRGYPVFSPDGNHVVTGYGEKIVLWDAGSGEAVSTFPGPSMRLGSEPIPVLFSPDGRRIVTAGDRAITFWDLDSAKEEAKYEFTEGAQVIDLALSPDGKRVAVTRMVEDRDRDALFDELRVVDVAARQELFVSKVDRGLTSVAFSPDGQRVASSHRRQILEPVVDNQGVGGEVNIWNAENGKLLRSLHYDNEAFHSQRFLAGAGGPSFLIPPALYYGANDVTFSGDGRYLACTGWDRSVKIWDVSTGREWARLRGQQGAGASVAFSPDAKYVTSSNSDGTIKVFANMPQEAPLVSGLSGLWATSFCDAFSESGVFAGGPTLPFVNPWPSEDPLMRVYDINRDLAKFFPIGPHCVLAISPDGELVATSEPNDSGGWNVGGGSAKEVRVRELASGRLLREITIEDSFNPLWRSVTFSRDGRRIGIGTRKGELQIWEVGTGHKIASCPRQQRPVSCIVFSPDDRHVASGTDNGVVTVSDAETGRTIVRSSRHRSTVAVLRFAPDGHRIASAVCKTALSHVGELKVWDWATGEECFSRRDINGLSALDWSLDGARLVTISRLGGGMIWDATDGRELLRISCSGATDVAFTDDGWRLLMLHNDSYAWPLFHGSLRQLDARPAMPEQRAARLLVDWLFDEYSAGTEVTERIRTHEHCSEPLREVALEAAVSRTANPEVVHREARQAVFVPGRHNDYYRAYRRRAENLCRLFPDRGDYFTTFGVALYRLGLYDRALKALTTATDLFSQAKGEPSALCLAYLAMTNHHLGHSETAQHQLDRLYGKWLPETESAGLLSTARSLISDPNKRELVPEGFNGHLHFLPDDTLLIGTHDGTIVHFDAQLKDIVGEYHSIMRGVAPFEVSRDGKRAVVVGGADDGRVELIEIPSGRSICTIGVEGFSVRDAAFSPDCEKLAVLVPSEYHSNEGRWRDPPSGSLCIYSAESGKLMGAGQVPRLTVSLRSLDWQGDIIAVAQAYDDQGRGVLLWDVEDRRKRHHLIHPGHRSSLVSSALSRDGSTVAVGYDRGDVGLWDANTGELLHTLAGQWQSVHSFDFSPDGQRLAAGTGESTVSVWDTATGKLIYRFPMAGGTRSVSFDSTGQHLACGTWNGKIVMWNIRR